MIAGTIKLRSSVQVNRENELVAQARYDSTAFVRLYRRHYDAIFRYCVHRLFEKTAAEDVTSEVFLKVVEKFDYFNGSEKQFRNWLYKIATNAVNNHLRKSARRNNLLKIAGEQLTEKAENCEQAVEKMAILKVAMLTLKPKYQTIITLRFFENLKLTEIAEVLDCNSGTVRSQLSRALARLRKKMGKEFIEK